MKGKVMKAKKTAGVSLCPLVCVTALCAGSWVTQGIAVLGAEPPAGEKKAEATNTEEEMPNWITLGVGGNFMQGDKAQAMRRIGLPRDAFGGVTDFHYEKSIGKKGLFEIDGSGIFDNHDYSIKLGLSHPDKGYIRAGYSEFRSYSDGLGDVFPKNGAKFPLANPNLALDRGEIFFEAGLTLPEKPVVTFEYRHQFRNGTKDSTSWGDSGLVGVGAGVTRGITASFYNIDEVRDIFALDLKHKLGNTEFGLGARYDRSDNNNARYEHRRPNEAADRYVTQRETLKSDMFNAHTFTETRFNDKVLLTTGYSFTTMDTDVGGTRIYGAGYDAIYDPLFARRQARDEGYLGLNGGAQVKQHVANLSMMINPAEDWTIVPAVRIEGYDTTGDSEYLGTSFGLGAGNPATKEDIFATRERSYLDVTEALEFRYTGFKNFVLYAKAESTQGQGDLSETELDPAVPVPPVVQRKTDSDRFVQKYTAGVNWYPMRKVSVSAQYYHKVAENTYKNPVDSTGNNVAPNVPASTDAYPAFMAGQDFKVDDVNFRVTLHPMSQLTLVSRYDFQLSTVDTAPDTSVLVAQQSAEMVTHIFSESISWTPISRLYIQLSGNYVLDRLESPADRIGGASTDLVLPSKNNYWSTTATVGFALDEKTDLQASYFYYRAHNFVDNSGATVPYGTGAQEHAVTAQISRQMNPHVRWTLKYGFYENNDKMYARMTDYRAHVILSTLQYRF